MEGSTMDGADWRVCPRCAAPLERRAVGGQPRPACSRCDFVYYADPKVTVALLIPRQGQLLLGRRGVDPGMGLWCLPGGFVEYGERLESAAVREVQEECALTVRLRRLCGVADFGEPGQKQGIVLFYETEPPEGEPRAGDDMVALEWVDPARLPPMAFPAHEQAIRAWTGQRPQREPWNQS